MTARLAKVLPKGQVTIPKEVREALGAVEGDFIVFREVDGAWIISRQPARLVEFMRAIGREGHPMSDEELERIDASGKQSERRKEEQYGG